MKSVSYKDIPVEKHADALFAINICIYNLLAVHRELLEGTQEIGKVVASHRKGVKGNLFFTIHFA